MWGTPLVGYTLTPQPQGTIMYQPQLSVAVPTAVTTANGTYFTQIPATRGYDFRDVHRARALLSNPVNNPTFVQQQVVPKKRKNSAYKSRWGNPNPRSRSRSPKRQRMQSTNEDAELVHAHLLGLSDAKHLREEKSKKSRRTRFRESRFERRSFQEESLESKIWPPRDNVDNEEDDVLPVHVTPPKGVKEESIPKPIKDFSGIDLHPDLQENLQQIRLTPIQQYVIPTIHADMDILTVAHAGSGKAIAYLAPVVSKILKAGDVARPFFPGKIAFASPLAVIIIPTRELANQLDELVFKLTQKTWIRSFSIFGGDNFNDQCDQINKYQIDILTATPGRLLDMLDANKISLEFVKYLILDEADNIIDLGLGRQTRSIVTGRDLPAKDNRVTVMFSATFPEKLQSMAQEFLRPHVFLQIGNTTLTVANIRQEVKWIDDGKKQNMLLKDLKRLQTGKIIVFVGRRQMAESIAQFLQNHAYDAESLHGQQDQWVRERTLSKFKAGEFRILCATTIAARGLNVNHVLAVINYDFPLTMETYTTRITRTGRIGDKGMAISYFNSSSQSLSYALASFLNKHDQVVPGWLRALAGRLADRAKKKKAMQSQIERQTEALISLNKTQARANIGALLQNSAQLSVPPVETLKQWPPPNTTAWPPPSF